MIIKFELEITLKHLEEYKESYAANFSIMNIDPTINDAFFINDLKKGDK